MRLDSKHALHIKFRLKVCHKPGFILRNSNDVWNFFWFEGIWKWSCWKWLLSRQKRVMMTRALSACTKFKASLIVSTYLYHALRRSRSFYLKSNYVNCITGYFLTLEKLTYAAHSKYFSRLILTIYWTEQYSKVMN